MKHITQQLLLSVVGVLALAGIVSSVTFDMNKGTRTDEAPVSRYGYTYPKGQFTVADVQFGYDSDMGTRIFSGTLKNITSKTFRYVGVKVQLVDSNDVVVGYTVDHISGLEPGQQWKFKARVIEDTATRAKISDITAR